MNVVDIQLMDGRPTLKMSKKISFNIGQVARITFSAGSGIPLPKMVDLIMFCNPFGDL